MKNSFEIEILEDGTISISSEEFGDTVHVSADEFLRTIEKLSGAKMQTKAKEHPFWNNRLVQRVNGKMKIVQKG